MTALSTRVITHKIIVKKETADPWRVIYLTRTEALYLMGQINDREVINLNFQDPQIIPNPPESYPKRWCHIEPITEDERSRWTQTARRKQAEQNHEAEMRDHRAEVDKYIKDHPADWVKALEEAERWVVQSIRTDRRTKSVELMKHGRARGIIEKMILIS